MTIWVCPLPTDMHIREEYSVFSSDWENDPLILFHATPLENLRPIRAKGFKRGTAVGGVLPSISFAKQSFVALDRWTSHRKAGATGVIIAVRFKLDDTLRHETHVAYVDDPIIQPTVIGYCVVPSSYVHR